jgi:CheY-like chemotaxis protein
VQSRKQKEPDTEEAASMESTDSPGFQIVLAEDNPADVTVVRMALREAGVDCALSVLRDGEEALAFLDAIDANPKKMPVIDLLLLDLHLPKRDGKDILKRLRSTENYAQTPVIVTTASGAPQDHDQAEKHAALYYFQKPSTFAEFMQLGHIVRDFLCPKKSVENVTAAEPAKQNIR